jgi:rhodanese-related sulfurtransferase/predicted transcriptional regulator
LEGSVTDSLLKTAMYEQFARVGKALANPARLQLLDLLAQGERSVEDLASAAHMRLSNTSAQLRMLHDTGLLTSRRAGTRIFYRLSYEEVAALVGAVQDFANARIATAEQAARAYLGEVADLDPIGRDELARRLLAGDIVVLDVRPAAEYAAGHIPGAVSMPVEELEVRLAELPPDQESVAYCRGRYCVFAPQAVCRLREHGYHARVLDGGMPEWRRAGLPVNVRPDDRATVSTPA